MARMSALRSRISGERAETVALEEGLAALRRRDAALRRAIARARHERLTPGPRGRPGVPGLPGALGSFGPPPPPLLAVAMLVIM